MAVIPFIPEGHPEHSPTIVQDEGKYDRDGDKVLIIGGDKEQFKKFLSGDRANDVYDLRIGGNYWDIRTDGTSSLMNQPLYMKPKMFVEIQTEETVRFPKKRAGRIASKVSMLQQGIGISYQCESWLWRQTEDLCL